MHFYNVYVEEGIKSGSREFRIPASSAHVAIGTALKIAKNSRTLDESSIRLGAVRESSEKCFKAALVPFTEDGKRFGGYVDRVLVTDYVGGLLRRACEHRDRFPRDSQVAYVQAFTAAGRLIADTRTGIVR